MTRHIWGAPPGYCWKVVVDPTRTGEEPGIFYGGHFRWSDIVLPEGCRGENLCPWPSGTVFENIKTGERVVVKRGRVVREVLHRLGRRAHREGRERGGWRDTADEEWKNAEEAHGVRVATSGEGDGGGAQF